MKFQNGAQIQDGHQTFLSIKTCEFNFYVKVLQDC
jgi:hypothetical protein